MPKPRKIAPLDPAERDRQILAALDLRSEFASLGVVFAKDFPRADGWLDCYAVARLRPDGREDSSPSAGCNIRTGRYHDFGGGGVDCSFWDFAAAMGVAADWRAAREHYAQRFNIPPVGKAVTNPAVSGAPRAKTPEKTARGAGDQKPPATAPNPSKATRNPLDQLSFLDWTPAYERLATLWTIKHKRGVTLEAIKAAGGRIAKYKTKTTAYTLIALPVWNAEKLSEQPQAYAAYNITGKPLPVFIQDRLTKKWTIDWKKIKTFGPTSGGLIGRHGLDRLQSGREGIAAVWKVEGPSDLLTLFSAIPPELRDAHPIITNAGGAGEHVQPHVAELLAGLPVNVVHDADSTGEAGALKWARSLIGVGCQVKHVRLPYDVEPKSGKDLRDYLLEPGNTYDGLLALAAAIPAADPAAMPAVSFTQSATPTPSANGHASTDDNSESPPATDLSNGEAIEDGANEDGSPRTKIVPLPMRSVLSSIFERTENWPRRVNSTLFVDDSHHGVSWLETGSSFFGWLSSKTGVIRWFREAGFCTKEETFQELRRTATAYASVEDLPHEPPIANHYYTGRAAVRIPAPDASPAPGATISELVNRFCPETEADRQLILAMFATAFWGGKGGSRPAFVITSDDGRGAGKSKASDMLAYLAGGLVELSANEDAGGIRKRLLSPEGLTRRIARLDNVKSLKFSWAELESLITSQTISGHRMYQGEGSRPNTLTWVITLNGISLSTDMAQRSVIIKVKKPQHAGEWEAETMAYIDAHRQSLIADLIWFLRVCPKQKLTKHSRWASWESEILSRLDDPAGIQKTLAERSAAADAETDEVEDIQRFFEQQLGSLGYDTEHERIHVPSKIACEWYNAATNDRRSVVAACRVISQFITEGKAGSLHVNPSRTYGRGFVWSSSQIPEKEEERNISYNLEDTIHREKEAERILGRNRYVR